MPDEKKHIVTSKEKMDAILGITGGKSVDDFLDDIGTDTEKLEETWDELKEDLQEKTTEIQAVDIKSFDLQTDIMSSLQFQNLESSMHEIEEMISIAKQIFKHTAENILASDLIDSELLNSASILMENIHINIAEFIAIYKQKQQFIDKIKIMNLQQQQKKELLDYKHKLDMEKINATKKAEDVIETDGIVQFKQEDIIKMIDV